LLPSVESIRGFAHAAGFAAARRFLRFLVLKILRISPVGELFYIRSPKNPQIEVGRINATLDIVEGLDPYAPWQATSMIMMQS